MSSPPIQNWQEIEADASAERRRLASKATARLLNCEERDAPRIGVCLSGGGWRAMTSGCALFDALSVPVQKGSGGEKVKPLDCVSHAFGLSGGSWLLFNTLAGDGFNAFHRTANPWCYGDENFFDPELHRYDGLAHMVAKEVVDEACHRGDFRKRIGFLSTRIGADATIAAALGTAELGPSLVERWANFIGNDILSWIDNDDAEKVHSSSGRGQCSSPPLHSYKNKGCASSKSRHQSFASCADAVRSGNLPYVVCAAIADKKSASSFATALSPTDTAVISKSRADGHDESPKGDPQAARHLTGPEARIYDWVEFTPFFARNPGTGVVIDDVEGLRGVFKSGETPRQLYMHHLMAICGSAFACDLTCALPPSLTKTVKKHHLANVTNEPLIGRGTTTVSAEDGSQDLGILRDAGIDFNIPLPPMLCEGREFDIILIMDAGAGSKNAFELARAVELGYVELSPEGPDPLERFALGHHVRVFRAAPGLPILIYFLGLCERGTHQIIQHRDELLADVERLRERVAKVVAPVLLAEMAIVRLMKQRTRTVGKKIADLSAPEVAEEQATVVRALMKSLVDKGSTAKADESSQCDADTEKQVVDALGFAVGDEVRAIMLQAATEGRVSSAFDAYFAAEGDIFSRLFPDLKSRMHVLFKFEIMALATFFPRATSAAPRSGESTSFISEFTRHELYRLEIIKEDPTTLDFALSSGWNDYFAATALASSLVRGLDDCLKSIGRAGVMPTASASVIRNLPLSRETKLFTILSECVQAMHKRHPSPSQLRKQYHDELVACITAFLGRGGSSFVEKQVALDNFIAAFTAAHMDNEIMAFSSKVDQRSQVMLACAAARAGNMTVLNLLPRSLVARKSVLGAAYESAASDDVIAWLKAEHGVSLSLVEAAEMGYAEAVRELLRDSANANDIKAVEAAIQHHREAVLAVLWAAAAPRFRETILVECADHAVRWHPNESKLEQLPRKPPTDSKARALHTLGALKDKAMTPVGMEGKQNARVSRQGVPVEADTSSITEKPREVKEATLSAAKGVLGKLFGAKSKPAPGPATKHIDPAAK